MSFCWCAPTTTRAPDLGERTGLSEVHIVQNCNLFSNVQDALDIGNSPEDNQIHVNPSRVHAWNPLRPGPNQALIRIDDDAAVMITFDNTIIIESLDAPTPGGCGEDHLICADDGSPGRRSEMTVVLQPARNTGMGGLERVTRAS